MNERTQNYVKAALIRYGINFQFYTHSMIHTFIHSHNRKWNYVLFRMHECTIRNNNRMCNASYWANERIEHIEAKNCDVSNKKINKLNWRFICSHLSKKTSYLPVFRRECWSATFQWQDYYFWIEEVISDIIFSYYSQRDINIYRMIRSCRCCVYSSSSSNECFWYLFAEFFRRIHSK